VGAGERSRYSDWLRAGRSGDRIPVRARFSAPVQTGPGAHTTSCKMGTVSLPGVESGRGVTLTPHPILVPRSRKKSNDTPLLSLRAFVAYDRVKSTDMTSKIQSAHKILTKNVFENSSLKGWEGGGVGVKIGVTCNLL
jgi:hypothetical protein